MNFMCTLLILPIFMCCMGQDCGTPGQNCGDDKDCCGGCCIDNRCISTYNDCRVIEDPCDGADCPLGQECYKIKPPTECVGCAIEAGCRAYAKMI